MTAATVDQLVGDYLSRLEAAAAGLPDARRTELLTEIREHIEAARSEGVAADEASTRTMLDQLGEPEEIVAAARAELYDAPDTPPAPAAPMAAKPGTGLELAAVLLLTIGSFIPFLGWLAGVALLWISRRWTVGEKLLGTLVVPTGPGGVFFFGGLGLFLMSPVRDDCVSWEGPDGSGSTCHDAGGIPGWAGGLVFIALLVAPFIVAAVLSSRARARAAAAAEPPEQQPAGTLAGQRVWTGTEIAAVVLLGGGPILAFMLSGILGTPIVVPLVLLAGLPFVWASTQWTTREKWIGTAIAAVPMLATFLFVIVLRSL